jgi:hypothetical protein
VRIVSRVLQCWLPVRLRRLLGHAVALENTVLLVLFYCNAVNHTLPRLRLSLTRLRWIRIHNVWERRL